MSRDNRGGRMYEKTLQDMQDQAGGAWLQVEGLANHNAAEFGLELPSLDLCGSLGMRQRWSMVMMRRIPGSSAILDSVFLGCLA
mmetsp:Transcript_46823/g.150505  ORF Transcript_46823/g.150505 Transcript_46823/m.150505 type:complete len:84 (+) Transcript_46823:52-303(+)